MSILAILGGRDPFAAKTFCPKPTVTDSAPSYKKFAGPAGQAFTAFRWARNVAIATTALSACLTGSTIYFANQQARVETAVVVLDPYGRVEDVVAASGFNPDDRVKGHLVAKFIQATRSISSDRVLVRRDIQEAQRMMTQQGEAALLQSYKDDDWGDPTLVHENRVRQVDNIDVFPPAKDSSTFTAMWRERLWDGGRLIKEVNMRGTVTLKKPDAEGVRDIAAIKRNPTGLWVDGFTWETN